MSLFLPVFGSVMHSSKIIGFLSLQCASSVNKLILNSSWSLMGGILYKVVLLLVGVSFDGQSSICPLCSKDMKTISNLKQHFRMHTGERPYPCHLCPYRASRGTHLRSHLRNAHKLPVEKNLTKVVRGHSLMFQWTVANLGAPFHVKAIKLLSCKAINLLSF